jgi:hypothetical protein
MGKVSGSTITLNGAGAGSTIIDGNGASRVFDLDPSILGGVTTSISGVTITNGAVTTFGGAGIIAGSGHATTKDTLTISNATITNNHVNTTTSNKPGGGVQFEGGSLSITNSTISNNSSGSSPGGGVSYTAEGAAAGEQLAISGTTFSGNQVDASVANVNMGGGALDTSMSSGSSPTFTVTNSRFINNTVTGSGTGIAHGGAIFSQTGPLSVTGSTFTGNSVTGGAAAYGGAISVTGNAPTLHYNRFTGNVGASGSAVAIPYANGATDNWWGCNTGPGTTGCDTVFGGPTVSPRLVLSATASPATVVGPNASSTITAALTRDSLGAAIGAANLDAFAGLPVSFTDPLPGGATLGAASANLSSGAASTTYNSQNSGGPGHVLATLDNGTATASITVNRAPAITSANAAPFLVGTAGSFAVTTTGYPTAAITRTGTLPPGMTFTDNGNGTATLAGTPTAGGSFPLGLTANNGVAPNAAQTLTVTVGQAPAITSATTTTFMVGTAGAFAVTTSGQPTAAITETGTLPAGLTFVDNGNGTATLAGTPAAGSGGSYPLGLTAANGVNPNGTQTLTVTVTQATAITANPNSQAVDAGGSVSFIAAASGFPTPTVQWQRSTDGGASFTNIAGATSTTYTFTTAAGDNGNAYRAVFTNVAGTATSTAATLTVASAPSITSADHATFAVGTAGSFTVTTSGFPTPTLTTTGTLPAWLSFTDHGNGTATLAGTPPAGSGGTYGFTITADNGTAPAASQAFTLTVDASPTVTSADHATFQVGTAGSFTVTTSAGFPVATTLTKTGTLPSGVTFTDNGNGTATLAGTPAAGTAGSYPLTITATNGSSTPATQGFTLTVTEASAITSADHTTFTVGSSGSFTVTTSPVATTVIETGPLPAAVSFTDHGDGTATLSGTPAVGTGGAYTVTLQATNAAGSNSQTFTLTVNAPSAITSADRAAFTLGTAGSFTVTTLPGYPTATTITTTGTLPAGVRFTDNGDGTATIAGTPTAAGSFPITITASNGVAPDATQAFTLTVNQAPSITSADHATFPFGSAGSFTVTTTAGYPTTTTLTTTRTLPSGVTFTDNGDGTATLAGTPTAAGAFPLTIKASNGATTDATQPFTLTVTKVPTIGSADHTTFAVGSAGSFAVTTTVDYPTATTLTESGPLPSGVSFTDHGDGTATLAGTPATGTAGSYPLTLTVANTAGSTQQSFTLTVTPANASPAITSADHATFIVGTARTFAVTTTAGYPAATTIAEAGALPAGVTFADNGDGTATLAGTPAAGGGTYALTITAGNGATPAAIQAFTLTVDEAPAVTSADHATFAAGSVGSFTVIARGFPVPTLGVAGTLPAGVTFTDHHVGRDRRHLCAHHHRRQRGRIDRDPGLHPHRRHGRPGPARGDGDGLGHRRRHRQPGGGDGLPDRHPRHLQRHPGRGAALPRLDARRRRRRLRLAADLHRGRRPHPGRPLRRATGVRRRGGRHPRRGRDHPARGARRHQGLRRRGLRAGRPGAARADGRADRPRLRLGRVQPGWSRAVLGPRRDRPGAAARHRHPGAARDHRRVRGRHLRPDRPGPPRAGDQLHRARHGPGRLLDRGHPGRPDALPERATGLGPPPRPADLHQVRGRHPRPPGEPGLGRLGDGRLARLDGAGALAGPREPVRRRPRPVRTGTARHDPRAARGPGIAPGPSPWSYAATGAAHAIRPADRGR